MSPPLTTPGPWKVWIDPKDASVNVVNAVGEYVCLVGRPNGADRGRILNDAHLIADGPFTKADRDMLKDALIRARAAFATIVEQTELATAAAIARGNFRMIPNFGGVP